MIDYNVFENKIATFMPSLFTPERANGYLTLGTPFQYPDGDIIDVFITQKNDRFTISDMGETVRHLGSYNINIKNSARRTSIVEDAVRGTGITFSRGILYKKIENLDTFAHDLLALLQAIIRV